MKKIALLLIILTSFCLPTNALVLVYKYKATQHNYDFDSLDEGWIKWKETDDGYFVIDTATGDATLVEYSKRQKGYLISSDTRYELSKMDLGKKDVWVITNFADGTGFLVFGDVKSKKINGSRLSFAPILRGNMVSDQGDDPRQIVHSQINLRLDSGQTQQAQAVHFDVNESVAMIAGNLRKKGYSQYVVFNDDSNNITNSWLGLNSINDSYSLAGYGDFEGATKTYSLIAYETVGSTNCVVLRIYGFGKNPVVQYYDYYIAEDTNANIHVLKISGINEKGNHMIWQTDSPEKSPVFLPEHPQTGQVYPFINREYYEVFALNWNVSQMSTGAGPYNNCMLYRKRHKKTYINDTWFAPNAGAVKQAAGTYSQNGWERILD